MWQNLHFHTTLIWFLPIIMSLPTHVVVELGADNFQPLPVCCDGTLVTFLVTAKVPKVRVFLPIPAVAHSANIPVSPKPAGPQEQCLHIWVWNVVGRLKKVVT